MFRRLKKALRRAGIDPMRRPRRRMSLQILGLEDRALLSGVGSENNLTAAAVPLVAATPAVATTPANVAGQRPGDDLDHGLGGHHHLRRHDLDDQRYVAAVRRLALQQPAGPPGRGRGRGLLDQRAQAHEPEQRPPLVHQRRRVPAGPEDAERVVRGRLDLRRPDLDDDRHLDPVRRLALQQPAGPPGRRRRRGLLDQLAQAHEQVQRPPDLR